MKAWYKIIIGVLIGLLASGTFLLVVAPPRGTSLVLLPLPTPEPIVVHVSGAVLNPGIYSLPCNSRVADAINTAGGSIKTADLEAINLAAFIFDGEKITVPVYGEDISTDSINDDFSSIQDTNSILKMLSKDNPLNINTANQEELESLPGIGPSKASEIIQYRQMHGKFHQIDDLLNVPGIGPAIYNEIVDLITIVD